MKKFLPLLISFLILSTGIPNSEAQVKNIIILVSDNEADLTLAEKIGELLKAEVVVTPWGIYNESISVEIINRNPSLVLIIGGPKAVNPQYESDLQALGIPYTRKWGETRVETALAVLEFIKKDYPGLFKDVKLAVVYGWDLAGILELRKLMRKQNVIPVYVSRNSTKIPITWNDKVIIVETPLSINILRKLRIPNPVIVRANITADVAKDAIERAEVAIERAKRVIELTRFHVGNMLESATRLLNMAKDAYSHGNYLRAYNYANLARLQAERIISMGLLLRPGLKLPPRLEVQMQLRFLKMLVMRLESQGVNVRQVRELISKAEEALRRGDISTAMDYIRKAKEMLKYVYRQRGEKGRKPKI
ncbi:hypothetical protein PNA2_0262 [Pyrococcus sp. NA2]|uniref:cell wall-binding repeat-containing protein n=1 Tax=Pyrococcus sp. (strain NA2) TaxID=342949 RepID=UPI000209AFD3|nr:cell wall-binding repeat-containing protein [Pyrococcus sp. NA2]AEC51180.1 hypothetical protein PNA2_0262 [Pyrococcus sp. NA2]